MLSEYPALTETFIHTEMRELLRRGHHIDVWVQRWIGNTGKEARVTDLLPERIYGANERRQVLRYDTRARMVSMIRALNLQRYGREAGSLRLFRWALDGRRATRPYDAIHAHFGPNGVKAQFLRDSDRIRGPLLTTFHGYDLSSWVRKPLGQRSYGRLFARGDLFLAVSARWASKLAAMGCPERQIRIHRVGVDLDTLGFQERPRLHEPIRLLSIGRLVPKKGFGTALHAVALLRAQGTPVEYSIIGDGPSRNELEGLRIALELESVVKFRGALPVDRVREAMKSVDLLLAPSQRAPNGDEEGIPVVIMEAMASGLPVVSTYHSGIPELVISGETGLLVAEGDPPALASGIEGVIDDDRGRVDMARAARDQVEMLHDAKGHVERLEAFYSEAGAL